MGISHSLLTRRRIASARERRYRLSKLGANGRWINGDARDGAKMTPSRMVGGYAAFMAVILPQTANRLEVASLQPLEILTSITALFIVGLAFWAYRVSRKAGPPA